VENLLAPDRYTIVLAVIILGLIALGVGQAWTLGRLLTTALFGVNIVYAMRVSDVPRRWLRVTLVLVIVILVLAAGDQLNGSQRFAAIVDTGLGAILAFATVLVIARRLVRHPAVTVQTITGALSIYLLLGIFFAFIYGFIGTVGGGAIFAQNARPNLVDFLYFSFVTLTTLGYGDLTPVSNLTRMLAITEALLGQFYLVTVVALLIAHVTVIRHRGDA
jgi:hypothetical protein